MEEGAGTVSPSRHVDFEARPIIVTPVIAWRSEGTRQRAGFHGGREGGRHAATASCDGGGAAPADLAVMIGLNGRPFSICSSAKRTKMIHRAASSMARHEARKACAPWLLLLILAKQSTLIHGGRLLRRHARGHRGRP